MAAEKAVAMQYVGNVQYCTARAGALPARMVNTPLQLADSSDLTNPKRLSNTTVYCVSEDG
jgi:hypothetical protein